MTSTDIRELSDQNIRHAIIKKLFSYYPNGRMNKEHFFALFSIKEKKETKENVVKPEIPKPEIKKTIITS